MAKKNIPAVSVIIPMFNAEKYIGECLMSLTNQTFQDFEVIVADDCSTDNSRAIVKSFSEKFGDRLIVTRLSKNSGSPSVPRNFALAKAHGKYVYFLDADDLLSETALEELYNVAENFNADVVHCEKYFAFQDGLGIQSAKPKSFQTGEFVTEPTLVTSDIGERVTGFIQKNFLWWGCNKLFRRKFLTDNKIKFPPIKSFEDFVFAFMSLTAAKNYVRVPFVSYYYRRRKDSLSHEAVDPLRFMNDTLGVIKSTDDFMAGRKFFVDNPIYRYMFADFFMQERLAVFSRDVFAKRDIAETYDFLYKEIFSRNPQDNVALTTYLFIVANIFKLHTKNLEAKN